MVPPGTEPAQLNNTFTPPACAASLPMACASRTSRACGSHPASVCSAWPSMSNASTRAPARAKVSALARPIPDAAAVTIAVLPASRSDAIKLPRGSGIDSVALRAGKFHQQHFARLQPLVIRTHQFADRPVAAPHEPLGAKDLQQVIDALGQRRGTGAAGLGDQAGQFADDAGAIGH